ncbi:MAG: ABC transporter ATP-binding protein [Lachnospiraceae bacterium]|nr:ABC transporter ATP-binding protein [Lachnospiraceae bacterium]
MSEKVLEVKNLETHFFSSRGVAKAVDRVSYSVSKGEILGVVGESGCGKSVTALSILQLIQSPPGKIVGGEILLDGRDLLKLSKKEMEAVRGNKISMIFQEPMTSLNPLLTVGDQIMEPIRLHRGLGKKEAKTEAIRMLEAVGIPNAEKRFHEYPNSMSGGMRQRVMIAMALSCRPEVLIADEPTTALDVTIQAQILDLMLKLRDETGTAIIMITHDLGVVAEMCDRAAVMYCGSVVEQGPVKEIFKNPVHPYTKGLIASIPKLSDEHEKLFNIRGAVPNLRNLPEGCRFADRCDYCMEKCRKAIPEITTVSEGHEVRCFLNGGE